VNRVSDREPVADDSEPGAGTEERPERDPSRKPSGTRLNEEDIPPATEAEALAPDPTDRARDGVSTRRASSIATWRPGGSERKALDGSEPPEANPSTDPRSAKVDSDARETGNTTERVSPQFDEGPNPLPPAIERDQAALPRFDRASARPPGSSDDPPENNGLAKREPINQARRPATPSAFERPSRATKAGVVGRGEDREPGALVVSPAAVAPLIAESDPFETSPEPVAPTPLPARTMAPPPAWAQTDSSLETDVPATIGRTSSDNAESANDRKPLTWAEVASNVSEMPPLEGGSGDTSPSAPGESRPADRSSTTIVSASASRKGSVQPICEYDERHRRILDFRLPDLEGKPVRLREIDADLVLIDFWGTWCQPCMRSIPHLVELQERMKDKRLAVIGIACEQDSPEHSSKRVAAVARKLEINYPVLLSRNDGSCPLQDALHISAFPTMVLVDREGRVVWRDQGATPATLARLDNVLDASSNSRASRRY
jgi:thiol-disulfide isomerase/thioredoxin